VNGQGNHHDHYSHRQPEGRLGKTTLSVNLAAAAETAGAIALIIDTDPQATASQWGAWRADKAPEVIDSARRVFRPRSMQPGARRDLHRDRYAAPCRQCGQQGGGGC
jgi:hypothetical protein